MTRVVVGDLPSTSIQYTILGVVPILCDTYPTVTSGLCFVGLFRYVLS